MFLCNLYCLHAEDRRYPLSMFQNYLSVQDNVTPAAVYEGRRNDILDQRAVVKNQDDDAEKNTQPAISSLDWRSNGQKSVS